MSPWLGKAHALEREGAITLAGSEDDLRSAVIDPGGDFAYFGTDTAPGRVVKVDLATFTRVGSITLETGEDYVDSAVIDPAGDFAYFGTATAPGRVVKVDLATFTRVGAITLGAGESSLVSAVIDPAGDFAYFGTATAPGRVVKVDLATFTRVGAIALAAGEDLPWSAVIDPAGAFAYFGTATSPGRVVEVDLATFTRARGITLAAGEDFLASAVIDPAGDFAYFGTAVSTGQVVKVDLAFLAPVAKATFLPSGGFLNSAVIDPTGNFAYFGAGTSRGRVVRVALPTGIFGTSGSATLEPGETGLVSAVIDPAGDFAYFGTATAPGRVVKVDLRGESPPPPPSPGASGKIAFAGEGHIEVINGDGTGGATLDAASPASSVNEPAWNATGTKLVFRKGGSSFSTMNADGSNVKPLVTMPSFAGNPTWSANGSVIAFDGYIGGINQENRIYTVPAGGGTATELAALDAKDPAYSPDGTKIAYEESAGESDIGVMNANGSGAANITTGTGGNNADFDPSWSPDGANIAFTRAKQIWTMNADGSGAMQLTTGADATYPTWSLDGTKIAFERDLDIWVMDSDGSDAVNITNTPDVDEREPDWGVFVESKAASTTTLTVDKTSRKIQARGKVSPAHGGLTVSVTLFKKRGGRFVKIETKKPVLTSESKYSASFGRPSSGTCKLKARFPGDSDHLPSAVSKTFKC